jgi:hypothetical protein
LRSAFFFGGRASPKHIVAKILLPRAVRLVLEALATVKWNAFA